MQTELTRARTPSTAAVRHWTTSGARRCSKDRYYDEDQIEVGSGYKSYSGKDHKWALAEALRLRQLGQEDDNEPIDDVFGWDLGGLERRQRPRW